MKLSLDEITDLVRRNSKIAAATTPGGRVNRRADAPRSRADDDDYVGVGVDGILAATGKLLAVNRGEAQVDERDSMAYKRIMEPDQLIRERIRMDADHSARKLMRGLARRRTLQGFTPFHFDNYATGLLLGNPLSTPLEEINPMHIVEQLRRVTLMGPGGIGSPQAITPGMQCFSGDTEVFTRAGWKFWPQVSADDEFACRVEGVIQFHASSKLVREDYCGDMLQADSVCAHYLVTPNHRFWSASSGRTSFENWKWETAEEQQDKYRCHTAVAAPYSGLDQSDTFCFPVVDATPSDHNLNIYGGLDMGDWCEYLGWWFAEGSCYHGGSTDRFTVTVTQCPVANPDNCDRIADLHTRLPFQRSSTNPKHFRVSSKQLYHFLAPFGKCTEKWLPDFLFEVRPEFRRRFLDAFLAGDGWVQKSGSGVYSTSSHRLADDLERLLLSLGSSVTRGTPWQAYRRDGSPASIMHRVNELTGEVCTFKPSQRKVVNYEGEVFCAEVPGNLLLVRRGATSKPFWAGNSVHASQFGFISPVEGPESERAGVDARLAWGVRIGSDGRLYQRFIDRKTGKTEWLTPEQLEGKVVKIPD